MKHSLFVTVSKENEPDSFVPLQLRTIIDGQEVLGTLVVVSKLAQEYAKNARSKNTMRSYESDWRDFDLWCRSKCLTVMPADPCTVACYLADRAKNEFIDPNGKRQSPLKTSSLARRLTAISQAHQIAGVKFDRQNPSIQETWKGIKNTHGTSQIGKEPLLIEDLRELIQAIPIEKEDSPSLIGLRNRALLLIGFAGAFRRSELVSLILEHLKFVRNGCIVTLERSKTDQQGKGREIAIPYGSNPDTCPIRALQDWITISKIESGFLFRAINRHGQLALKPLTAQVVSLIIKENLPNQELTSKFSGHSLRAGFATTAALAGVQEYAIMKQTGHKRSDTLKKYIRSRELWKDNPAAKIGL
jgi:site-specific recombinase XerD